MDGIHNLHYRTKLEKTNNTYQIFQLDEIKYEKHDDMDD